MNLKILLICFLFFLNCLYAKKSIFDISTPSSLFGVVALGFLNNSNNNANCAVVNGVSVCDSLVVSPLYPTNGKLWNYYVKNDGTDRFSATDTACVTSVTGGYNACLHGGEMRKMDYSSRTSCINLTANDNLNAFVWTCKTTATGIQFVSIALNPGKGLSDLIDWNSASPSFQNMNLTIKESGISILQTANSKWWENPITIISPDAVNTSIASSSTIYLLNTSTPISETSNIPQVIFNAPNIAFLIKPGIRMTATAPGCVTSRHIIDFVNSSFSWVEGDVDATMNPGGINIRSTVSFAVIRNVKIQNTAVFSGCTLSSNFPSLNIQGSKNYISNVKISNSRPTGILFTGINARENLVQDVSIINSQDATLGVGVKFDLNSNKNFMSGVLVSNNSSHGLLIQNTSNNNYVLNLSSMNNSGTGETLASSNILISNILNLNNNSDHLQLNGAANVTLQNYVSGTPGGFHVNLSGGNTDTYFTGVFKVNSVSCQTAGGSTGGIISTCNGAATGAKPADINYPSTNSFLNFSATPLTLIVFGSVNSDSVNTYYATGTNSYNQNSNWNEFQNFFRGIGKSGTFPTSAIRGACISGGTCQLYDWTLKSSDTIGLNTNPCPGNTAQLPSTTITHTLSDGTNITFLRNAIEIIGDGIGNENGFCESNESCLFTPNIGAYQGHGNLISASTAISNTLTCSNIGNTGSVTNVILYKYESNGY